MIDSMTMLKCIVPNKIIEFLKNKLCAECEFSNKHSYSQEGEDLILLRHFGNKKNGSYVDVGAHHPKRFSNTYCFYLRGWRGINIDANQDAIELFNRDRPEDVNIFQPISLRKEKLKYYVFNEPALNTFDKNRAIKIQDDLTNSYEITKTIELMTKNLTEVLDSLNIPKSISFLSIDVEGLDFQVIQSLDLNIYHPEIILIESLDNNNLETDLDSDMTKYLKNFNYSLYNKTFFTCFYLYNPSKSL